jgi:hypothetical protein
MLESALAAGNLSPEVGLTLGMKVDQLRRKATSYDLERKREYEWNRADALAAYDGGGHTNPKWDAAAREALTLHVRPRVDPNRSPKDDGRILEALRKAVELGCDDAFVLYAYAVRYRGAADHDPARAAELLDRATEGLLAGKYTAFRRMMALARRAALTIEREGRPMSPGGRRDAGRDLERALALLPEAAAQTPPRGLVYDAGNLIYGGYKGVLDDPEAAFAKVHPVLRSATEGKNVAAVLEADFHLAAADSLRTGTDDFARRFKGKEQQEAALARHRAAARAAIEAAIAIDPADPVAVTEMLRYLENVGADAEQYDKWFARAMEADPNNLRACQLKRRYLERQGGGDDAALEFARQCLATANWSSRIPFVVIDVHANVARFDRPGEHFARPDVWADVRACYEGYLQRYPNAVVDRSRYAQYACWAEQWAVAKEQFDKLGDDAVYTAFRGKQTYEYYRGKAARLAGQAAK